MREAHSTLSCGTLARSCRAERAAVRRCWRGAVSSALFPLHRSGTRTFLEDEVDNPKVRDELLKTATPTLPEPGTRTLPSPDPKPNTNSDPNPNPYPSPNPSFDPTLTTDSDPDPCAQP